MSVNNWILAYTGAYFDLPLLILCFSMKNVIIASVFSSISYVGKYF